MRPIELSQTLHDQILRWAICSRREINIVCFGHGRNITKAVRLRNPERFGRYSASINFREYRDVLRTNRKLKVIACGHSHIGGPARPSKGDMPPTITNKSWNPRFRKVKTTKSSYWREVPINAELEVLLKELKLQAGNRVHVFPRFIEWDRGEAAKVLRRFCAGTGLKSIKFHALRACFATQLLRAGIAPVTVMAVCGWKELKTMQCYVRLSGIEIDGATDKLQFISTREAVGKVIELFGNKT